MFIFAEFIIAQGIVPIIGKCLIWAASYDAVKESGLLWECESNLLVRTQQRRGVYSQKVWIRTPFFCVCVLA